MVDFSPATQAVMDAAVAVNDLVCTDSIAAALRAVTKELKFIGITEKNILAIAAELEGHD